MDRHHSSSDLAGHLLRIVCLLLLGVVWAIGPVDAADLHIGTAEMYSHGYMQNGQFVFDNYAKFNLAIQGGMKFQARLSFGLETSNFNFSATPTSGAPASDLLGRVLLLNGAEATAKNVFGLPLDFTYFLGQEDVFGSGAVFPTKFDSPILASSFGGYTTYPTSTAILYDGIYQVDGNGLKISFPMNSRTFIIDTYLYQDGYLGNGVYSADVRVALNLPTFKLETFVGATVPEGAYGLYRAGLFFYYRPTPVGEFMTAVGLTHFVPGTPINVDDFYLLLEPRVHFDPMSIILTLFWHPAYYLDSLTNEGGNVDVDMKLQWGNPEKQNLYGGLENLVSILQSGSNQFTYALSPYLSLNTSGVIWDLKITAVLLPFAVDTLFQGYLGIRTEF